MSQFIHVAPGAALIDGNYVQTSYRRCTVTIPPAGDQDRTDFVVLRSYPPRRWERLLRWCWRMLYGLRLCKAPPVGWARVLVVSGQPALPDDVVLSVVRAPAKAEGREV